MTRAQKMVTRIFNLTSNRLRIRSVSSVKCDSRLIACCGSMGTLSNIQEQERGAQIAERSTRNGERWAANVEQGIGNGELGMTVFYSDPFSVLLSAILNCYADYRCIFGPSSCSWFPVPRSWFNNIHLVLTQIQTDVCVSVSLQMCDNILFHYLCGCKMNCFRTVGLINTSIVYAVTFCCCLG